MPEEKRYFDQITPLVHGGISLMLVIVIGLSGWTLLTTQALSQAAAVQQIEIEHLKKDIASLGQTINRDLEQKFSQQDGQRLQKKVEDTDLRIGRIWDVINEMRSFQRAPDNQ